MQHKFPNFKAFKSHLLKSTAQRQSGVHSLKEQNDKLGLLSKSEAKIMARLEHEQSLQRLPTVRVYVQKDKAHCLIDLNSESLHKHGYRQYVGWGAMRESLGAACLLQSGILDRARKENTLRLWDPFCGSGLFLLQALLMLVDAPIRSTHKHFGFEVFPSHPRQNFLRFREQIHSLDFALLLREKLPHFKEVSLLGSDLSGKAIQTAIANCEAASLHKVDDATKERATSLRLDPTRLSKDFNYEGRSFLRLIESSFEQTYALVDSLQDFTLITNVPYGRQSKQIGRISDDTLARSYQRFGGFLRKLVQDKLVRDVFVVAPKTRIASKSSFETQSGVPWKKVMDFHNGPINVFLLQLDTVALMKRGGQAYVEFEERIKVKELQTQELPPLPLSP